MTTETFYEHLVPIEQFTDLTNSDMYTPLPNDWHVAISDVVNSTGMIDRGLYKAVNLIGASSIMAVLNLKKSFSIPFMFGGDGAAICIPEEILLQTRRALLATKQMASALYGIDLRVGIIPVSYITQNGFEVLVARYRQSSSSTQAAFSGGGVQFAEDCLKNPAVMSQFTVDERTISPSGDFSGLECRWENVPSAHDEIVSLIVQAIGKNAKDRSEVYRSVLAHIAGLYGDDSQCHPVRENLLSMTMSERNLFGESDVRSYPNGLLYRMWYAIKIRWNVLLGKVLMALNVSTKNIDWGTYKKRVVRNTDFKKFDDKIRQVLSGSVEQRIELDRFLSGLYRERKIVYGIHSASSALITCLLFNYSNDHVHLVDADQGGYAAAAAQMKAQLKEIGYR